MTGIFINDSGSKMMAVYSDDEAREIFEGRWYSEMQKDGIIKWKSSTDEAMIERDDGYFYIAVTNDLQEF